ncbi:MAG: ketoacyl-ACP synthase III [Armatimonadetes bacterium]|nr:ketoacyl-ACP synthase III [Armatimonadota bacterium]MCA1996817.1 ketoacyl-ACP synthase III [Armatimonadota bacterium]
MSTRAVVLAAGHYTPERVLTNADLEKMVDTSDEWIVQRTGMKERRICSENETTSTIAIAAAREALERSGLAPEQIDLVVCGTVTGDMWFPSTSAHVHRALGLVNAGAMDVGAACAGFIYSLSVASAMIEAGHAKRVIVIGADALTKFTDYTDRSTCILFGDGGGALVLEGQENSDRGVLHTVLFCDGNGIPHIDLEVGGSRFPAGSPQAEGRRTKIYMNGNEVYRFAVKAMGDACVKCLEQAGMSADEVDLFVPHQANIRIIESAAKRIGLPDEKVFINIDKYGNTSGGSIPLSLYEAERTGRLKRGMVVMTVGFGAGLVWGANLIRW